MPSLPESTVERFINAYNEGDDQALLECCHQDILVMHHNRGAIFEGKAAFAGVLEAFKGLLPDKHFYDRRSLFVSGSSVIIEHCWSATALDDVPGFGARGETIVLDLCTRYTVENGLVREYHDYG